MPAMGMGMSEEEIQKHVVRHFRELEGLLKTFTFFAVAGGSVRLPVHIGKKLKDMGAKAGVHDLIFLFDNAKIILIELKTLTGALSDAQKAFHGIVKGLGHASFLVKVKDGHTAIDIITTILKAHGARV